MNVILSFSSLCRKIKDKKGEYVSSINFITLVAGNVGSHSSQRNFIPTWNPAKAWKLWQRVLILLPLLLRRLPKMHQKWILFLETIWFIKCQLSLFLNYFSPTSFGIRLCFLLKLCQAFHVMSKKVHRQKPMQFRNIEVYSPLLAFSCYKTGFPPSSQL